MIQENIVSGQRIRNYTITKKERRQVVGVPEAEAGRRRIIIDDESDTSASSFSSGGDDDYHRHQEVEDENVIDENDNNDSEIILAVGSAIGRKRIHIFDQPIVTTNDISWIIKLSIHHSIATPQIKLFAAYSPCDDTY